MIFLQCVVLDVGIYHAPRTVITLFYSVVDTCLGSSAL